MNSYIVVDTEYTTWPGALESGWSEAGQHREIVQIAAVKIDEEGNETDSMDILVRPLLNPELSPLFTELTGITQNDTDRNGMAFSDALNITEEFTEQWKLPLICMNGDGGVVAENCRINGIEIPDAQWHRLVPYLIRCGVNLEEISSGDLHKLTNMPLTGRTHNALHDVRSMARWIKAVHNHGDFDINLLPTDITARDHRRTPIS